MELEMNYNYCGGLKARSDIIFPAPLLKTNCCRLVILPFKCYGKIGNEDESSQYHASGLKFIVSLEASHGNFEFNTKT